MLQRERLTSHSDTAPNIQPTGTWRRGSFEVVNLANGELLYSKVATGEHLMGQAQKVAELLNRLG